MSSMFNGATAFNGNITSWNTAAVTNMQSMFYGAIALIKILILWLSWNTAAVTDMSDMFYRCYCF